MEIEAKSQYTYQVIKEYQRFNLFKGKHYNKGYILFATLSIIALIIVTFGTLTFGLDYFTYYVFITLIFLNILMAFLYFMLPGITYKSNKNLQNIENKFVFSDDEITIASENQGYKGNATMKYNLINKVYETKKYIYIYINRAQAYIIDKTQIDGGRIEELRETITSRIPKKKYIICKD